MGGCGLGGVCDHINHLGYHIKEKLVLKAWGAATLKKPGENTAFSNKIRQYNFRPTVLISVRYLVQLPSIWGYVQCLLFEEVSTSQRLQMYYSGTSKQRTHWGRESCPL